MLILKHKCYRKNTEKWREERGGGTYVGQVEKIGLYCKATLFGHLVHTNGYPK